MDMFVNTDGHFISSHIIHHILQFGGIDQFQFVIEENGEYIIKLKVTSFYDKNDESAIEKKYREYLGQDAIIRFEYVKDIPLLASGKRKLVVNNFKPSKNKRPRDLNGLSKSTLKDTKLDLVK